MATRSDQKRYLKLTPIERALDLLLREVEPPKVESVPTQESLDRLCAADYTARWDVPRFDVAAMDGYAVRASDLAGSGGETLLAVRARVSPRGPRFGRLGKGEAFYVSTGSPIPRGADTVLRVEETRFFDEERIAVGVRPEKGKNVSRRGEDFRRGDPIVRRGERITPSALSALVYFGVRRVKVWRRPRVGVLSVGDELADFESNRRRGVVYNNYAYLIHAYLRRLGLNPKLLGVVADDSEKIAAKAMRAMRSVDLLLTIGGTSVGLWDNTPNALSALPGSHLIFHGLRAVPIKPTGALSVDMDGGRRRVFAVMLPAHVVSAALSFHTVVLPVISSMEGGGPDALKARVVGVLESKVENPRNIDALYLVELRSGGGEHYIKPLGWGSNLITNLLRAGGFIRLSPSQSLEAGDKVTVELLGPRRPLG